MQTSTGNSWRDIFTKQRGMERLLLGPMPPSGERVKDEIKNGVSKLGYVCSRIILLLVQPPTARTAYFTSKEDKI